MFMKKNLLSLLAALLLATGLQAQTITFDQLPVGKGIVKNSIPHFIGCDGESVVLIQRSGRLKNRLELVKYTMGLKEQCRAGLDGGEDYRCYGGYINDGHIDLLYSTFIGEGMRVYRDRRSLATLAPEGEPLMLADYSGEKGDRFYFGNAVSPNGKLLAGVFVADRTAQGTEVKVCLYNHQLEAYWTQNCSRSNFDNIYATDEGDVILYSFGANGECRFTILDGEDIRNVEFKLPEGDMVLQRELLRYGNGNILLATAVRHESHTLMPVGANIDGIDIYCYNIAGKKLTVQHHPFTMQEVNRLCNDKEDRDQRHLWVQFGHICQRIADSDGAYLMVDQSWTTTLNGVPTGEQRMGMMVMRVDPNGKILWTTAKRTTTNTSWNDRDYLDYKWLPTPTGVMLAWTDHIANISFPPSKQVKLFSPFKSKATLNVWTLTHDGKEDLSFIELSRQALAGPAHSLDTPGEYIVLLTSGNRQQLTKVKIEK